VIVIFSVLVLLDFAVLFFPPFGIHSTSVPMGLNPEAMAPNSVVCILASSISLLLLATFRSNSIYKVSQFFSLTAGIVSMLALIGYSYTIEPLYGIGHYRAMSLPGAVVYLLLAIALFFVNPDRGLSRLLTTWSSAGILSRRLFSAVLFLPPALGFISLLGATVWDIYDWPFSVAVVVVMSMILFSIVIAITSHSVEGVDLLRLRAEEELRRSRERLRELSQSIQIMQEEERIRIAREVHDELGQLLTAIKMDMSILRSRVDAHSELEQRIGSTVDLVNSTIKTVQRITSELRPSVLDNLGLAAAIEWQAREFESRSGVHCTMNIPDEYLPVSSETATAVFRIFQETITNVGRHADASDVEITLEERQNSLVLEVRDNGVGLAPGALERPQSFGVMGMRERAKLVGGTIAFYRSDEQRPDHPGTTVHVTIPLPESFEEEALEANVTDEE
jgi:signal transduction histidine kinase